MAAVTRRKKTIGQRRRIEDDGDEEAGPGLDLDDDSLTDPSSDEHDPADDSDTSNVDEVSPRLLSARKALGNGSAKHVYRHKPDVVSKDSATKKPEPVIAGADVMLEGLTLGDKENRAEELEFDDIKTDTKPATAPSVKDSAPVIVSSTSIPGQQPRTSLQDQKRREHDEYRKKRDEDPTFVPNRGNFFLHDHRHAGPAANGFRPYSRQPLRGRGGGRAGAFGREFIPMNPFQNPSDPTTRGPWQHDMHEQVAEHPPPAPYRPSRYRPDPEGPANGNGVIPYAPAPESPINRNMSSEKVLGTVTVRVYLPNVFDGPKLFPGLVLKAYTKLPDHRPPLRRDKPVRISLPYHSAPVMPRYIYPNPDRSFIFIPRALRPNQQRTRGKGPRSIMGSGPFSRRTSVWGGSIYGSMYSPSVAMSRRSSIAHDMGRDFMLSPTGSAISRPPLPADANKPVVRLPPFAQAQAPAPIMQAPAPAPAPAPASQPTQPDGAEKVGPSAESSINALPQPQTHPLPQRPAFQENKPNSIPMHQPRPQKAVSIDNIESPVRQNANAPAPYQQAFLHQVPPQIPNGFPPDVHARHPSYQSQLSATPLSQIPERAIHAAPFQPNTFGQPGYYAQPYPAMQPQQGYYYPQGYPPANMAPNANAPSFVPAGPPAPPPMNYAASAQGDVPSAQAPGQAPTPNLVTQEVNGTVYYFNANDIPSVPGYAPFPPAQPFAPGMVPGPDAYYYQQPTPGMVYYPQ